MSNKGIYFKFNVLIVGTIFFCGMIMGCMLLMSISKYMEDGLIGSGQELASSLAVTVGNDILFDDKFSLWDRLSRTMDTNEQVRYIIVTYPNGEVMFSTFGNMLPEGLNPKRIYDGTKGIDSILYASSEGRIREIMVPVDEGMIGYIRVGMSEKKMMYILQERSMETGIAVLLLCAFASFMASRYAWYFLRPISKLAYGVNQLEKGNYGVVVPVYAGDEVGKLAETFNRMSAQIKKNTEENNHLLEELKLKEQDRIWLINQLFKAREDEQHRISRELHDESSQSMASILTYLRILHDRLDTDEQREMLFEIRQLTAATLGGIRQLAVNLHPPLLDDLGLIVAIEKYLDPLVKINPDIKIDFCHKGNFNDLPKPIALMCYRTIQEAVANSIKHAAPTNIRVDLESDGVMLVLTVYDDGRGFSEDEAEEARLNRHLGLVSMKERAQLLDGSFKLVTGINKGTTITVELPIYELEEGEELLNGQGFKNPVG
ncbi:MAG: HAMP domain-containing protein [Anaerovibrio sp.]|uniref:ATP-binding protein n=1 Tax=Anaerovibrio sp. TaxID=1872532 RepID=UPI0025D13F99|nr:ATP-binding protein [Anaerovibrio sp.]MCR5176608.1 HAMP domain-containing protein [Anaerovibrio sp.]